VCMFESVEREGKCWSRNRSSSASTRDSLVPCRFVEGGSSGRPSWST
jgi:hypothetical protein